MTAFFSIGEEATLSGEIPKELGACSQLTNFSVPYNKMKGSLPVEIFDLGLLELTLTGNDFSGEIPAEIEKLTTITDLYLDDNEFEGVFPSVVESHDLTNFNVSYNKFTSVPGEIFSPNATSLSSTVIPQNLEAPPVGAFGWGVIGVTFGLLVFLILYGCFRKKK